MPAIAANARPQLSKKGGGRYPQRRRIFERPPPFITVASRMIRRRKRPAAPDRLAGYRRTVARLRPERGRRLLTGTMLNALKGIEKMRRLS